MIILPTMLPVINYFVRLVLLCYLFQAGKYLYTHTCLKLLLLFKCFWHVQISKIICTDFVSLFYSGPPEKKMGIKASNTAEVGN